jgi:hypothetical protein
MSSTSTDATYYILNLIIQKFPLKITPVLEKKCYYYSFQEKLRNWEACIYLNNKPLSEFIGGVTSAQERCMS